MEDKGAGMPTDRYENRRSNEVAETDRPQKNAEGIPNKLSGSAEDTEQCYMVDPKSEKDVAKMEESNNYDPSGEVNMEATINPDDVIRAGGFGARDDLSSFLPVASDSTDFEASLLDARDYEEPQGELRRPGLGECGTKASIYFAVESS